MVGRLRTLLAYGLPALSSGDGICHMRAPAETDRSLPDEATGQFGSRRSVRLCPGTTSTRACALLLARYRHVTILARYMKGPPEVHLRQPCERARANQVAADPNNHGPARGSATAITGRPVPTSAPCLGGTPCRATWRRCALGGAYRCRHAL